MNVQQVEYIIAVAQLKSFGKAAERCHITQSTLSTMVGRFEDETGIVIFDRSSKPISITKEGQLIVNQLKEISRQIDLLKELTRSLKGELTGRLSIGVIPTVAPFILPEFLNAFAKKFPKISFSVSEVTTDNITKLILGRELDVGIVAIPLGLEQLTEIPLYNEPFVMYDCSDAPMKSMVNIEDIDSDRFWLLEEGHCLHTQVRKICDSSSCSSKQEVNFDFRAGSIDSLVRFVRVNKGQTVLPYLATLDFRQEDRERLGYFEAPVPVRKIGLIVHKHFMKKKIVELLQLEIQQRILPLLNMKTFEEQVLNPL